jgi:hypothetical protein
MKVDTPAELSEFPIEIVAAARVEISCHSCIGVLEPKREHAFVSVCLSLAPVCLQLVEPEQ